MSGTVGANGKATRMAWVASNKTAVPTRRSPLPSRRAAGSKAVGITHHGGRGLHSGDEGWVVRHPQISPEPQQHGVERRADGPRRVVPRRNMDAVAAHG